MELNSVGNPDESKLVVCNKEDGSCIYTEQAFINDIDRGLNVLPEYISRDGKFLYMAFSPSSFKEKMEKKKDIPSHLAAFVDSVTEEDNLIIMKIRLK